MLMVDAFLLALVLAALWFMRKSFVFLLPLALLGFVGYKTYLVYKIMKNNKYYIVNAKCTGKKNDIQNFGYAKNYEFEPLPEQEFDDVFVLYISNEDFGFFNKNKIRIDSEYKIAFAFDKAGNKKPSQETYIGFERVANKQKK